jgi:hypothetical protein
MEIRIRATGAVMFESEFREYLKTHGSGAWNNFPLQSAVFNEFGADPVLEGPQSSAGRYQIVYRDGVEHVNGQWFTKYRLADMDADAIAAHDAQQAKNIRDDRNRRLADCDWTQLADAPVDDLVWAAYRQSLRDIPLQAGFPWDINWPAKP